MTQLFQNVRLALVCGAIAGLVVGGCIDGNDDDSGGDGGGAPSQDVGECKEACNQLKFFDCANSADHAQCFSACERAGSGDIELFVSCVQADICDASCVSGLGSSAPPSNGGGDGGGGANSCESACQEVVDAGCLESVDCGAVCAALPSGDAAFLAYCVERRQGCEFPPECSGEVGGPSASHEACQDGCDAMVFWDCIDAAEHADCRDLCTTVEASVRDTFAACAANDACDDDACYAQMRGGSSGEGEGGEGEGGEGGGDAVPVCQATCDDINFFECIGAAEHAECRAECTTAWLTDIEDFVACWNGPGLDCEGVDCWDYFRG